MNRREALRKMMSSALDSASSAISAPVERQLPKYQRPPGALGELAFLSACSRCGECVAACPHQAIGILPEGPHPQDGTPAMNLAIRPCHLCEDTPCITVCEPGALQPIASAAIDFPSARIVTERCFTWLGPECGACAPICPNGSLKMVAGKPVIDAESCAGCGLCRQACPVYDKAIELG